MRSIWQWHRFVCIVIVFILALGSISPQNASAAALAPQSPDSFPTDPTADIAWSADYAGVADIQAAFNNARTQENAQLGTSLPVMTLPNQATWDSMSDNQKALWLINQEREARGVHPLHGVEANVTSVAQNYADYLMDNDLWGHYADGHDPWWRLEQNPAINACHDFLNVAENLAAFMTSGSSISLPIERSIYMWMYDDSTASIPWGHRHAILWYPYTDNGGTAGMEGFLGIGRANGPYGGYNFGEVIVMNVFDPCASWDYSTPVGDEWVYLPTVLRNFAGGGGGEPPPPQDKRLVLFETFMREY